MSSVKVFESPTINQTDSFTFNGQTEEYKLHGHNSTSEDLILLYIYRLPHHQTHGFKIGMTKCKSGTEIWKAIESRISKQDHEVALPPNDYEKYGMEREVVFWGVCINARHDRFKDYYVHKKILERCAGITERKQEWFTDVPEDKVIEIFRDCRTKGEKEIYTPRKEQRACVDALLKYFKDNPINGKFLLNCKMRFGKSYVAYKFCEEADLNRVLILTFVPAVEGSWDEDLSHIAKDYKYYTDENLRDLMFQPAKVKDPFVMFLSLQNFLGKDRNSADTKARLLKLQQLTWDLVILDEYHFGAWNERTQSKMGNADIPEDLDKDYLDNLNKINKKSGDILDEFHIKTKKKICLSGTPFKALASGEFRDAVYSYTYFDEQRNKYPKYETEGSKEIDEAYRQFPDMKIFGYNMSRMFGNMPGVTRKDPNLKGKTYFSLNRFFATRKDINPGDPDVFVNEEEVKRWLEIIKGHVSIEGTNFPYTPNGSMVSNCRHTLWLMPSRSSTTSMSELLKKDPYFQKYEIIDLSMPDVGVGPKAYNYLIK